MKIATQLAIALPALVLAGQAMADATFYSRENFRGDAVTLSRGSNNFERQDFDDRASSLQIDGGMWEVCDRPRFQGRCVTLRRGNYASLGEMGLDNSISSARPVDREQAVAPPGLGGTVQAPPRPVYLMPAPAPAPVPVVYEVTVLSAQPVFAPAVQRCWTERVSEPGAVASADANIGGAVLGGVVGGLLGHQVGKGSGKDAATVGGAVVGAVIGSQVGKSSTPLAEREMQRCETVQGPETGKWEVTYVHAGVERRAQVPYRPGRTIRIDVQGQPML